MPLNETPKIDRPREKLERYGPGKLSNSELLAILLRTGKKGVNVLEFAKKILQQVGNQLAEMTAGDLKRISGLGSAKACEIVASFELSRRLLRGKQTILILSPQDVWNSLKDIRDNKKEHFVVFYLDTRHQEIKHETISVGTLNANLVHPREVFEQAIRYNAAQILVAHNHPSGSAEPSAEDVSITNRLVAAGKLLGIEVVDHVVVSKAGFASFKEQGLLELSP